MTQIYVVMGNARGSDSRSEETWVVAAFVDADHAAACKERLGSVVQEVKDGQVNRFMTNDAWIVWGNAAVRVIDPQYQNAYSTWPNYEVQGVTLFSHLDEWLEERKL